MCTPFDAFIVKLGVPRRDREGRARLEVFRFRADDAPLGLDEPGDLHRRRDVRTANGRSSHDLERVT